jgi:predicted metal-binding membrane protein
MRAIPVSVPLTAGLLGASALGWAAVVRQSSGMDSAPGTMGLTWIGFIALWTLMMGAMMVPALTPLAVLYAGDGRGWPARAAGLTGGYLLSWALFGVLALAVTLGAERVADDAGGASRWAAALILIAAGVYQLTPLKDRCLTACRSPIHLLMHVGRYRGRLRHLRSGMYHGAYCVGCCWSLMVALIALGIMDLAWMAAFAIVITLEKVWRHGRIAALAVGVALIALGLLVPSHPGLAPGLHHPAMPMEQM